MTAKQFHPFSCKMAIIILIQAWLQDTKTASIGLASYRKWQNHRATGYENGVMIHKR